MRLNGLDDLQYYPSPISYHIAASAAYYSQDEIQDEIAEEFEEQECSTS